MAGLTGFSYRLGLIGVDLWGLALENIRHAHSHLMFFCWAVPLPMYFVIRKLNAEVASNGPNILMGRMALVSLVIGLASFPFFLLYGYRPVPLGGLELPFSVILSGIVMLCWYGFMIAYRKVRKYADADLSLLFYDGALVMLFICSLGAWGVAAVQFSGVQSPLFGMALTHFFLATFTEGWVVLALLGILYDRLDIRTEDLRFAPALLVGLILFGAPLTFPYGISEGLLNTKLLLTARAGGMLAAAGLGLNLYVLYRRRGWRMAWYWKVIMALLILKAGAQFIVSVVPSDFWMSEHGLRIFYLHLLLLGGFTLVLFSGLHELFESAKGLAAVTATVLLVLTSLLLLTPLWPAGWFTGWEFYIVAAIALLPALAAAADGYFLHISSLKTQSE